MTISTECAILCVLIVECIIIYEQKVFSVCHIQLCCHPTIPPLFSLSAPWNSSSIFWVTFDITPSIQRMDSGYTKWPCCWQVGRTNEGMSSRFYSSGRKRSSGKTAPACLTQTFKRRGVFGPLKGFSFSPALQQLSLSFPLSDLSMVSYSFSSLSTQSIEAFFLLSLLLSCSQSHFALHTRILFLSPLLSLFLSLLYLANYQIKEHPTQSFLI